jgi:hypothetical protein
MSASFSAAASSPAMLAPAARYASSRNAAFSPAPASTATSAPSATSYFTVSGEAATRVSLARRSRGMAIFM